MVLHRIGCCCGGFDLCLNLFCFAFRGCGWWFGQWVDLVGFDWLLLVLVRWLCFVVVSLL